MQLTTILPTYNEAQNLLGLVSDLFALPIEDLRVLVVDDASPDGTGMLAEQLACEHPGRMAVLHRPAKLGLGSAYYSGFQIALRDGAEAVAQMDADFSHSPEKLPAMLAALENFDVVLGSRYVTGGSVDLRWPFWRKSLSSFGNFYARQILSLPIRDVTGGFRLWRRDVLERMPLERIRCTGYAYLVELVYVASRLGFSFVEIPIYFADRRWGQSKMSFRIQREAALQIWQMKLRYRDLHPKPNLPGVLPHHP